MQVDAIVVCNFGPFRGEHRVDFRGRKTIGVAGRHVLNKEKSNRVGKSFLLESIRYALYGKHRMRTETELITNGEKHMWVRYEGTLSNGKDFTVERGRNADGKGYLEVSDFEGAGQKKGQEALDILLAIDDKDFDSIFFCRPDELHSFMEAGPTEQSRKMRSWAGIDRWKVYEDAAAELLAVAEKELLETYDDIDGLEEQLEDADQLQEALTGAKAQLETASARQKKASVQLEKVRNLLSKLDDRSSLESNLETITDALETLLEKENTYTSAKAQKKKDEARLKKVKAGLVDLETFEKEKEEAQQEVWRLETSLQTWAEAGERGGVCPILSEKCDRIGKETVEEQKKEARDALKAARTALEAVKRKAEGLSGLKREKTLLEARIAQNGRVKAPDLSKREGLLARQKKIEADLEAIDESKRTKYEDLESKCQKALDAADKEVSETQESIGALKERKRKTEEASRKITKLEKAAEGQETKVKDLRFVRYMFGKDGIPSHELESMFGEIEERVSRNLSRLGSELTVHLSPVKVLKKMEPVCPACGYEWESPSKSGKCPDCKRERKNATKDELQFEFTEGEKVTKFYGDSGGGKVIISLAVRIAIADLRARRSGTTAKFFILDEPFIHLDEVSRATVTSTLLGKFRRDIGVDRLFVISHVPEIRDAVEDILYVVMDENGDSRPEWA